MWLKVQNFANKWYKKLGAKRFALLVSGVLLASFMVFAVLAHTLFGREILAFAALLALIFAAVLQDAAQQAKQRHNDMLENRKNLVSDLIFSFICEEQAHFEMPFRAYLTQTEVGLCAHACEIETGVIPVTVKLPRDRYFHTVSDRYSLQLEALLRCYVTRYCTENNMPIRAGNPALQFPFIDVEKIVIGDYEIELVLTVLDTWQALARKERTLLLRRSPKAPLPTLDDDLKNDKSEDDIFL